VLQLCNVIKRVNIVNGDVCDWLPTVAVFIRHARGLTHWKRAPVNTKTTKCTFRSLAGQWMWIETSNAKRALSVLGKCFFRLWALLGCHVAECVEIEFKFEFEYLKIMCNCASENASFFLFLFAFRSLRRSW
jgi:hypothetical protein